MITNHTTIPDTYRELATDRQKVDFNIGKFSTKVTRATQKKGPGADKQRYVTGTYRCPSSGNTYDFICLLQESPEDFGFYTDVFAFLPVETHDGKVFISYTDKDGHGFLYRFQPHFLSRYKERAHLSPDTTGPCIVAEFWTGLSSDLRFFDNNEEINANYARYINEEGVSNVYAKVEGGIVFANFSTYENHGGAGPRSIHCVDLLTYVSDKDLKRGQKKRMENDRKDHIVTEAHAFAARALNSATAGDIKMAQSFLKIMDGMGVSPLPPKNKLSDNLPKITTRMRKNFSKQEAMEMAEQKKNGVSVGRLSKMYNTSANIVMATIEPYIHDEPKGEPQPEEPQGRSFTQAEVEDILSQVAGGTAYSVIASRYEAEASDIAEVVNANGDLLTAITERLQKEKAAEAAETAKRAEAKKGPITDEEREEIFRLKEEGLSVKDIAELVGRTPGALVKLLHDYDRKKTQAPAEPKAGPAEKPKEAPAAVSAEPSWTKAQIEKACVELASGKDFDAVNEETGIPVSTLRLILGAATFPPEKISDEALIRMLYDRGYRIENGQLIVIRKVTVDLGGILG